MRASQTQKILRHLQSGFKISPLTALELFGCFRLTARIYELKEQGYSIDSKTIELRNGKRVKQYFIPK